MRVSSTMTARRRWENRNHEDPERRVRRDPDVLHPSGLQSPSDVGPSLRDALFFVEPLPQDLAGGVQGLS